MSEREPWLLGVAEALERRIAASGARPDFLDVVERAHALDPAVVTEAMLEQADALAAEEAEPLERGPAREEAAVDAWLHDVRAAVERRVEERREQELPRMPEARTRRGVWWIAGAAVAAAALLVLGLGRVVVDVGEPEEPPGQALHMNEGPGAGTGAVEAVEMRSHEAGGSRRTADGEAVEPAPEPAVEPEPEPEATEPEAAEREAKAPASASRKDRDRFAALAEAAQAHWRAGRREEAQRLLAEIVAEAGRSRAAELAYADLFTLASQAGDPAAQRRWWASYLRRFPRGRFADDARAGLCRGGRASERAACWQAYLDDFPRGSFRGEARAARGEGAR
jgi:hypothetical protein